MIETNSQNSALQCDLKGCEGIIRVQASDSNLPAIQLHIRPLKDPHKMYRLYAFGCSLKQPHKSYIWKLGTLCAPIAKAAPLRCSVPAQVQKPTSASDV